MFLIALLPGDAYVTGMQNSALQRMIRHQITLLDCHAYVAAVAEHMYQIHMSAVGYTLVTQTGKLGSRWAIHTQLSSTKRMSWA